MRCPFCGFDDTQVKDSRPTEDNGAIRRRRFCGNCGQRFTTIERVQLRELTVIKSDGRRVPFDRDKLARSIRISMRKRPIQEERIERIVNSVVRQLEASGDSDIPSKQIGELVMDTLKELDKSPMCGSPASTVISVRRRISRSLSAVWRRRRLRNNGVAFSIPVPGCGFWVPPLGVGVQVCLRVLTQSSQSGAQSSQRKRFPQPPNQNEKSYLCGLCAPLCELCVETRSLACHRLNRFAPRVVKAHPMTADIPHMRAALALARRGLGTTWPNPSVGCVIVRDGRVVGRGNTAPGGRPHAEPIALAMAGDLAKGATAYVSLQSLCPGCGFPVPPLRSSRSGLPPRFDAEFAERGAEFAEEALPPTAEIRIEKSYLCGLCAPLCELCVETRSLACHRLNRFAPRVVKAHPMTADIPHMRAALALARRGLGTTWPNPSVGCVIVRDERVVGRGNTAPGGRPHAEPIALAMAGDLAKGATAYVSLEPCCHWGRSPPCTDALIAAGIARIVIATGDPDPRVNSLGLKKLRGAGITVETGLLEAEAKDLLLGFSSRVTLGRPMVTLKLAIHARRPHRDKRRGEPVDHRHARPPHRPCPARPADAVMVGVGTVLADNPDLTCRIPGFRPTPVVRVIADSHLRTPLTSRLAGTTAEAPVWFLVREGTDPARRTGFTDLGATLIESSGRLAGSI